MTEQRSDSADSDAGCVECGNAVDRTLPDPIPEGYECMWSEAMTGKALYCLACYSVTSPGVTDSTENTGTVTP